MARRGPRLVRCLTAPKGSAGHGVRACGQFPFRSRRAAAGVLGVPYPTDVTDRQWRLLEPVLGVGGSRGPRPSVDRCRVVNAVLYQARRAASGGICWKGSGPDFWRACSERAARCTTLACRSGVTPGRWQVRASPCSTSSTRSPFLRGVRDDVLAWGIQPLRGALRRLDEAYAAFYRRCAAGQTPGHPRFKSRRRFDTVCWDEPTSWSAEQGVLGIQGVGNIALSKSARRQLGRLAGRGGGPSR